MPDRYQLTEVWKTTLGPQDEDDHSASRDRLRQAFINFRERAARLGNEIPRNLPYFTVHDITHLDALWSMVDLIAGPDYHLTPAEAFILGGAILVHDLAMSQAAFQSEFDKLKMEPLWRDTVAGLLREKAKRSPTPDEINSPDDETEKLAIEILLRELHARQAAVLPTKQWGYAGTTYYLLDDADLRAAFSDDIGKVAFSHHWPLEDLLNSEKLSQHPAGGPGWLPHQWTVDLVKLACLLRTADAAQADDRRAPGFLAALRQPSGISDQHWRFQSLMRTPHREEGEDRLRYRSNRPFKLEEFKAWWVAYDWLRMADHELWRVDALLADTKRPRFAAKGICNVENPRRLAEAVRTEGWEPVDAEVRVRDVPSVVRMLGGIQLYGNRPEVPLRELIQNASDAVRARRKLENRDLTFGRITVRQGSDWIEVEDNGIGMSKSVLTGALLDFGSAFWGTAGMRREFPGLQAAGMQATGQFGIGFFSVFMWGDHVQVTTRRFDRGYDETWVLEFQGGVELRPLVRKGTQQEQQSLPEGGTRVRVWCEPSRQIHRALVRCEPPGESSCTWQELCEWLAPALDVDLNVEVGRSSQVVVQANDWQTIDAETMLLRLNRKSREGTIAAIRQHQEIWPQVTALLRIVRDDSGQSIARGTVWSPERIGYRDSCAVCGGLRTDGGANFFGIRFARPDTAARHGLAPSEHHRQGWFEWAEEQSRFDDAQRYSPEVRAQAAIRLVPFLHPGSIPIGRSHRGWVTLDEFAREIRGVSNFQCAATSLWMAPIVLSQAGSLPTIVVNGHYVLNQIDGGGFAIVRRLQAMAENQWAAPCDVSDLNQGMNTIIVGGQIAMVHYITFTRSKVS